MSWTGPFSYGIAFDASAVPGFGDEVHSDLFLHPDTQHPLYAALAAGSRPGGADVLPRAAARWRRLRGRLPRRCCDRLWTDAEALAFRFSFGTEMEFYLFQPGRER